MADCSRLFRRPGKDDVKYILIYLISFYILSVMYKFTLQGGDVKFVTDRVALFAGVMMIVTISALLLTIFAISKFPGVTLPIRLIILLASWWIFLSAALSDMNTTLQFHGQYNFTMFSLLFCLGFSIYLIITLCSLLRKRLTACQFWGGLLLAIAFFMIYWLEQSRLARKNWNKGISGRFLEYQWEGCNVVLESTPWAAIIPRKTFNFFLSETCPTINKFSSFNDSVLTIECSHKEAEIIEYPDFLSAHTDEFILEENGLNEWKPISKLKEKRYKVLGKSVNIVNAEYFQVFCGDEENFYVQHIVKEEVVEKVKDLPSGRMNLLMFQIDTLSRAHFIRRMTETVEVLERINSTEGFEVFQYFRLSTIGYNTEINTKALYTGSQFRRNRSGRTLWDLFSKQGNVALYLNGFCEDWSSRFLKQMPSGMDYLLFLPWCHPEYTPVNKTFSNFDGVNSMRRRCINGELVHNRVFRYLKEFWSHHNSHGKMVLAPMQESHEASMDVISTLDPDMADLLSWYQSSGELNNTIILITSDHGSHMSLYYIFSKTGQLEHKMPELFMIFPSWFLNKYPYIRDNMKNNEQPLISHYDTHWALASLLHLEEFGGKKENEKDNEFIAVWDCRKNEKFIKDIWYFRNKTFYNTDAIEGFDGVMKKVLGRVKECVDKYERREPEEEPIKDVVKGHNGMRLENIPPCESKKCYDFNVFDVIKDVDSYFWLLDALTDVVESENREEDDITKQYYRDLDVFTHFKGNGYGRYRYGESLFHYSSNKTCSDIGTSIWCACS